MSASPQFDLAQHPTKDTIKMLTSLLEKVTQANDRLHPSASNPGDPAHPTRHSRARSLSHPSPYTCFHARSIPNISIHSYLNRILKYCPCANECFLSLLVYFDRMSKPGAPGRAIQPLRIDSFNIHRLIIAGVMVASKLFSDVFFTNTRYAKVGGLPVSELNVLELEFLYLNNYSLFITVEELQHYGDQLLLHWLRDQEGYIDSRFPSRQIAFHDQHHHALDVDADIEPDTVTKQTRHPSSENASTSHYDQQQPLQQEQDSDDRRSLKRPTLESSDTSSGQQDSQRGHHLPTPPDSFCPSKPDVSPSPSTSHDSSRNHPRHPREEPAPRENTTNSYHF